MVDLVPLDYQGLVVPPANTHGPEGLPQGGGGEALVAGQQPDLKQHTQHALTQLVPDVIWSKVKGQRLNRSTTRHQHHLSNRKDTTKNDV